MNEHDAAEKLTEVRARSWKTANGIMVTEERFLAEVAAGCGEAEALRESSREAYRALASLVEQKRLTPSDAFAYAIYGWCLHNPEAIVAYQTEPEKWRVNNCGTKITEEEAIVAVNREFGFEASRIRIIGTPYYDATDWQFIRFDCAGWAWLWQNGGIYLVYAD